jgi:hypothetical protein
MRTLARLAAGFFSVIFCVNGLSTAWCCTFHRISLGGGPDGYSEPLYLVPANAQRAALQLAVGAALAWFAVRQPSQRGAGTSKVGGWLRAAALLLVLLWLWAFFAARGLHVIV